MARSITDPQIANLWHNGLIDNALYGRAVSQIHTKADRRIARAACAEIHYAHLEGSPMVSLRDDGSWRYDKRVTLANGERVRIMGKADN
jgi:hypothetical protein